MRLLFNNESAMSCYDQPVDRIEHLGQSDKTKYIKE